MQRFPGAPAVNSCIVEKSFLIRPATDSSLGRRAGAVPDATDLPAALPRTAPRSKTGCCGDLRRQPPSRTAWSRLPRKACRCKSGARHRRERRKDRQVPPFVARGPGRARRSAGPLAACLSPFNSPFNNIGPDLARHVRRPGPESIPQANKMLIDATHPEETRVVVLRGSRIEEFDFEAAGCKPLQRQYLSGEGDAGRALAPGRLRRIWRQSPRLPCLLRNPPGRL